MSYTTIGTCSICGGTVKVPTMWHGTNPPTPTCTKCGAVKDDDGPIIKMKRQEYNHPTTDIKIWYT